MVPVISVIFPVYNAAEYIYEAIESILNQSFENFELLIINDGSKDNSKQIIQSFSDIRIKYIENEGNKGLIYTLNRGIIESKGKYIARMDADDIALPNRFEKQHLFMEKCPEFGACGTYATYIGNRKGNWQYPITDKEIKCRLMWGSGIIHPTALIRKSILNDYNIKYSEDYIAAEDFKIWVDISNVSQLYNLPEVLLNYRSHGSQVTTTKTDLMNHTKCRIIIEQLTSMDMQLSDSDKLIVSKFIVFTYNFKMNELIRLFEIYLEFITKNNLLLKYDPSIINSQIEDRLFEASYFSTKNCGLKAVNMYRKTFTFEHISIKTLFKFKIKALLQL